MKVYLCDADGDEFRGIYLTPIGKGYDFFRRFQGAPMKNSWTSKEKFKFVPRKLPKGDTPSLHATVPVFNSKAVKALGDLLKSRGELLPITCQGEPLFLFNVTRLIEALDEENCELERFDDGRILDIDRHAFFSHKLIGETIFKLRQDPLGWAYVTDPFVERVKSAGLKGFKFPPVWSGD
jgi:hypothetical protein